MKCEIMAARNSPIAAAKAGDKLSGSPCIKWYTAPERNITPTSAITMVPILILRRFMAADTST
jgi:hypothetical protein